MTSWTRRLLPMFANLMLALAVSLSTSLARAEDPSTFHTLTPTDTLILEVGKESARVSARAKVNGGTLKRREWWVDISLPLATDGDASLIDGPEIEGTSRLGVGLYMSRLMENRAGEEHPVHAFHMRVTGSKLDATEKPETCKEAGPILEKTLLRYSCHATTLVLNDVRGYSGDPVKKLAKDDLVYACVVGSKGKKLEELLDGICPLKGNQKAAKALRANAARLLLNTHPLARRDFTKLAIEARVSGNETLAEVLDYLGAQLSRDKTCESIVDGYIMSMGHDERERALIKATQRPESIALDPHRLGRGCRAVENDVHPHPRAYVERVEQRVGNAVGNDFQMSDAP